MALSKDQRITLYTNLVRTRAYDELFVKRLADGRLLGFYHQAEGGEAPDVGACSFLRDDDYIFGSVRGHSMPHTISKGIDPKYFLAEHTGKATGSCGGMSSFHSVDLEHGQVGAWGTIGSVFPVSVGLGLAARRSSMDE